MSNVQQNGYIISFFRSDIADPEYMEVVDEYHSTEYTEPCSVQQSDTSNVVHIAPPNIPPRHQQIKMSLPLICLISICSLIAIVLTGVVTFFVTKGHFQETQCHDAEEINCYWSSWSSWYKCSVTCGIGIHIRIKQQMSNTKLCNKNETFDSKICSRGECTGGRDILDMRFSRTALHKNMFISADNTIISNVLTNDTSSSADAQLKNYKGTISDHCVGDNELIYYEVNYTYTILKALTGRNLVLEIGLAERSKVDRLFYGGNNNVSAWSFHLAKKSNKQTTK
ncbi:unnamed protein product [Mytilus edulis]|uniref:Uncharacterized protein n=1 Tax=Mytilus edulis TaxID=6550 RepID=A0A8S3SPM4_MYTED|nr:unnamed protein product [Mytilus edulis]